MQIFHANCQSARDGAIITNYLHKLYPTAYAGQSPSRGPSMVETCHFSPMSEMWSLALWIHWRELDKHGTVQYRVEIIHSATLRDLDALLVTRCMLLVCGLFGTYSAERICVFKRLTTCPYVFTVVFLIVPSYRRLQTKCVIKDVTQACCLNRSHHVPLLQPCSHAAMHTS